MSKQLSDLEITRACAEAMGYTEISDHWGRVPAFTRESGVYNPLSDDAQAMALVKRFKADVCWARRSPGADGQWFVDIGDTTSDGHCTKGPDLNRAICLCVAQMHRREA